jgi:hypothetical protein
MIGVGITRNTNHTALQQPHAKQVSPASEGSTSFSAEKEAKRLLYAGSWALLRPKPKPKTQRSFLVLFSKKNRYFLAFIHRRAPCGPALRVCRRGLRC